MNMFTEHLEDQVYDLDAKILSYRAKLSNMNFHESMGGNVFKVMLLKQYDEHFNIKHDREGKI